MNYLGWIKKRFYLSKIKIIKLKKLLATVVLVFITVLSVCAQYKLVSWNAQNMGKSKTQDKLDVMASFLKDADIIALQEIVKSEQGIKAVQNLTKTLEQQTKKKWQFVVSKPTSNTTNAGEMERYAFIWRADRAQLKTAFLDTHFESVISREPYMGQFLLGDKYITVVSMHAVPKNKFPEQELKYLKEFPSKYRSHNLIFLGDFNIAQSHSVFNPLKKAGYQNALTNQKTTLKQKCVNGDCLASEYDNIFYPMAKIELIGKGIIRFYENYKNDLVEARKLSDHLPIYIYFKLK